MRSPARRNRPGCPIRSREGARAGPPLSGARNLQYLPDSPVVTLRRPADRQTKRFEEGFMSDRHRPAVGFVTVLALGAVIAGWSLAAESAQIKGRVCSPDGCGI